MKGGAFIYQATSATDVFVPEGFNEEQRMIKEMIIDFINQEVLDSELASGVRHIIERYNKDPQLVNFQFQDDTQYLNMDKFNEFGMQEFVNQGVYMTSKGDVLSGVSTLLDIITIGTDGKCIYKVRSSRFIPFSVETNLKKLIQDFEYVLIQFYQYNAIFKQTNS